MVKYSPIICLLSPFLDTKNFATDGGLPSRNFFLTRYATPSSGFLLKRLSPTRYSLFLRISLSSGVILADPEPPDPVDRFGDTLVSGVVELDTEQVDMDMDSSDDP